MICRHCQTRKVTRPRGLCWTCFYTPGVREQYPANPTFYRPAGSDPSEEAIEQMIAQQQATMPPSRPRRSRL